MKRSAELALTAAALGVALVVLLRPLFAVRYPAMTDLPFHAAHASVFRHHLDPSFHFAEQFELQPVAVPYLTHYLLGALLMLVLPAVPAIKLATAIVLGLVPLGVATLAWGMKKSPLLALGALPLVWCELSHWGFVNFVGALGLYAACLGLTMRAVEAPTTARRAWLGVALVLVLVTHPFRFPFAVLGVALTAISLTREAPRLRPLLTPLGVALSCFAVFWLHRPESIGAGASLGFEPARLAELSDHLLGAFDDPREALAATRHLEVLGVVALVSLLFALWDGPRRDEMRDVGPETEPHAKPGASTDAEARRFARATHLPVALSVAGFVLGYLVLPMEIGAWWYVYPREATAAVVLLPALLPDLPKPRWLRALLAGALGLSSLGAAEVVTSNYARFDATMRDFDAVVAELPQAPKLAYLVFDHTGSTRTQTPYIHLPAYVQAEKGGWLSFHFAVWGSSPIRYRDPAAPGAIVPPPVPRRFEWTPERFDLREHGRFFDWFLVRARFDPAPLFRPDPEIERVAHDGTWWLYARRSARSIPR
jgi:hypothetical protein